MKTEAKVNKYNLWIKNKKGEFNKIIYLVVLGFIIYALFFSVLPSEKNVLPFVQAANECTGNNGDTSSSACTAYGTCNGGPAWSIGGEVSATTCCGDDAGEYVKTESSSTDAPAGYNDGITACCSASTDCNYNDVCYASGSSSSASIPNKAYCSSGVWYGGDYSSSACSAVGGTWVSTASGGAKCCGDDSLEDFESTNAAGNSACYNGNVLADGSVSGSILVSDGLLYDCNGLAGDDSGLAAHVGTHYIIEGKRCLSDGTWTTECAPTKNSNWIITTVETCDNAPIDLGTGTLILRGSGMLRLKNNATLNITSLKIEKTGDAIIIDRGSLLIIQ